ncbi:MAG: hypothetical protein CVV24_14220 [Ignavibacteriae bacterium HGW-Ignavibacteriae-3]|nr:MAG: hypothetical protein CVV24_14220 [Ignavibacteriae bacterium HGW-Ignavibacteriae-3]
MKKISNRTLIFALIVLIVLFLYFGGGPMLQSGMNGRMNGKNWMVGQGWGWSPAILILVLGVIIGWLLFKKKK